MELLGDLSQVESHFGPFGDCVSIGLFRDYVSFGPSRDSANLDARKVHGLRRTY
jgi:hypothetical protein